MDKPSPCFDWGTHRHRGKLAVAAAHTTRRGIHTPGVVDGASERASDPDRDTLPGLPYQAPCLTLPHLLSPLPYLVGTLPTLPCLGVRIPILVQTGGPAAFPSPWGQKANNRVSCPTMTEWPTTPTTTYRPREPILRSV